MFDTFLFLIQFLENFANVRTFVSLPPERTSILVTFQTRTFDYTISELSTFQVNSVNYLDVI